MTHDEARKKIDEVMTYWGGYLNHYSDEGLHREAVDQMLTLFSDLATSCVPPERAILPSHRMLPRVRHLCFVFNRCREITLENIANLTRKSRG